MTTTDNVGCSGYNVGQGGKIGLPRALRTPKNKIRHIKTFSMPILNVTFSMSILIFVLVFVTFCYNNMNET